MNIGEKILSSLSSASQNSDCFSGDEEAIPDNALDLLTRVYPSLDSILLDKRVVDFGCGFGCQSIALAKKYGCSVVGIDSNRDTLNKAIENAKRHKLLSKKLSFVESISADMVNRFDVVISQNSFEHFENPSKVLDEMRSLLNDSGVILLTFGPPWLAPYGSHMHFFCRVPWVNLLFSEEAVMNVRGQFRSDGAKRYENVESGLNKMTIAKFERIVSASKLKATYISYECIKGLNSLAKLPLLRELFINHVTAVLSRAA